jgi:alpha-L-rhamnosidase
VAEAELGPRGGGLGQKQSAYQMRVAGSEEDLRNEENLLWDSGKVASECSVDVEYGGKSFVRRSRCMCRLHKLLRLLRAVYSWRRRRAWSYCARTMGGRRNRWLSGRYEFVEAWRDDRG